MEKEVFYYKKLEDLVGLENDMYKITNCDLYRVIIFKKNIDKYIFVRTDDSNLEYFGFNVKKMEKLDCIEDLENIAENAGLDEIYRIGKKWFGARTAILVNAKKRRVDGINLNEILKEHGLYINEEG